MKSYKMKINGNEYEVAVKDVNGQNVEVEVNGTAYTVELAEAPKAEKPRPVVARPAAAAPAAAPAPAPRPSAGGAAGSTRSPLPGTVLSVNVTVGQTVKASDVALVLEAMKMENNINCGRDGVVKAVYVQKGDNVLEGAELLLVE